MVDGELLELLRRGVLAIERLAEHFNPTEPARHPRQAVLGKAMYTREDKAGREVREALRGQKPRPAGGVASPTED